VQAAILQAIEDLKPTVDAPLSAHTRQAYELLHNRFVERLTLEQTAERMYLSLSSTWRAQRTAVHTLAQVLWKHHRSAENPNVGWIEEKNQTSPTQATDWQTQASRELALLEASAPNAVSDMGKTIAKTLTLMGALLKKLDVRVETKPVQPNLVTAIHPSVLQEVLIAVVGRLAHRISSGPIRIYTNIEDGAPKITITGAVRSKDGPTESDLVGDILKPEDIFIGCNIANEHVFIEITTPAVGRITVLVVDDNEDMIYFYRRCTEGTRYHVVQGPQGPDLFEKIKSLAPEIVVLDIMLPNVDGWELLIRLHEDHNTRGIPIIVSSVVKEEELALSLGASGYLSKPVKARQFIQALDQVLPLGSAEATVSRGSNETAC
jgi:CheY-like chemotaxis protein